VIDVALFPPTLHVRTQEPMANHTSFGLGGPADFWVEVRSTAEIVAALAAARAAQLPYTVLGHGTNVLVADAGIAGLVIRSRATGYAIDRVARQVRVESGHTMARLAGEMVKRGFDGLTWGVGVPGTVGGAVAGNAGAFGGDVATSLVGAQIWYPEGVRWQPLADLEFGYRYSALPDDPQRPAVLAATFTVWPGDLAALRAELTAFARRRRATQPRGYTAGSFFKNPPGDFAGRLIEAAGLKGARRGGAVVSSHHANFLSRAGAATSADVLALACHVQRVVEDRFGVRLEPEVRLLGRWGTAAEALRR